ncbi:ethanolamine utilization protein EutH, partial [Clostridium perfringens]
IGIMLCGAFPMVYLIKKYLAKPLNVIGKKFGLSTDATTGLLAAAANVLALFAMIKDMNAEDKVKTIAFSVCGAFLIGDHLAFTANFQPNLILPIMIGKLVAGVCAVIIAVKIAVPKAKKLEELSTEV